MRRRRRHLGTHQYRFANETPINPSVEPSFRLPLQPARRPRRNRQRVSIEDSGPEHFDGRDRYRPGSIQLGRSCVPAFSHPGATRRCVFTSGTLCASILGGRSVGTRARLHTRAAGCFSFITSVAPRSLSGYADQSGDAVLPAGYPRVPCDQAQRQTPSYNRRNAGKLLSCCAQTNAAGCATIVKRREFPS